MERERAGNGFVPDAERREYALNDARVARYFATMAITFDPAKRAATLANRGLDFHDAARVFAGATVQFEDDRFEYGETRNVSYGLLHTLVVVVIWTDRGGDQHIISMRKATRGEQDDYFRNVG